MDTVIRINDALYELAWGTFGIVLLLGTGLICSIITGLFQITHIGHWLKNTFGIMYRKGRLVNDAGAYSQLRTFCTALCGTIGTGNIAGVSTAICVGGPGAIFWMWVAAFFGMMLKYSENVLGIYFRRRNKDGAWSGGPMYYLQDGLGGYKNLKPLGRLLGILFCIFAMLASFGIGNMGQINKITVYFETSILREAPKETIFGIPTFNLVIGLVLTLAAAIIIFGGFRRLAAVSERLIPIMSVMYVLGCLLIIILHIKLMPEAFSSIFRFALGSKAIGGGAAGTAVQLAMNTIKNGCKRGVFSNEQQLCKRAGQAGSVGNSRGICRYNGNLYYDGTGRFKQRSH